MIELLEDMAGMIAVAVEIDVLAVWVLEVALGVIALDMVLPVLLLVACTNELVLLDGLPVDVVAVRATPVVDFVDGDVELDDVEGMLMDPFVMAGPLKSVNFILTTVYLQRPNLLTFAYDLIYFTC